MKRKSTYPLYLAISMLKNGAQAGTDCGFDTAAGMGRVTSDIAWAKLKAMREGADIAATRLF